jgi:hypothetical protein
MEIIGKFSIKKGMIKAPPGIEGEYVLELNKNGSFIYRPVKKVAGDELTFEVWDITTNTSMSFPTESKAIEYKLAMEKSCGRSFRMKKVFPSAQMNGKIVEE